jgi:hypothetical protein
VGRIYTHREPVRLRTTDAAVKDTLLDTRSLITTNMRINAVPGPKLPDLGVLLTGNAGPAPKQKDPSKVDRIMSAVGDLTDEERAELAAEVGKFSGREPSRVSNLGAMSNDANWNDDQRRRAAEVRQGDAFNAASRKFWADRI